MLTKVKSITLLGIDGLLVDVEVDISSGLPCFDIVGLPDSSVKESKERVKTAINNSGFTFPVKHITVNLAPADIKKEGPSFDLPIAVGILCSTQIITNSCETYFIAGELSLDGTIKPVKGILPMIYSAYRKGINKCIIPFENAAEAAIVTHMEVYGVKNLTQMVNFLNGTLLLANATTDIARLFSENTPYDVDFSDVKGQESVKRAFEISAAAGHNILVIGPPGSGKTMMARRLPTIMPDLSFEESIEITKIYSISGILDSTKALITERPFRAPHHSMSYSALIGGGRIPKPGEISMSHNGVLFLDELPEFQKKVLENLRQPMEDQFVTIARVNGTITYPANFMLAASMNPCPCGYLGDPNRCSCTENEIAKYLGKISGPLLDRIDIHVEAPAVSYQDLEHPKSVETSAMMKARVTKAHEIQKKRYANDSILFNSQLTTAQIEKYCRLGEKEKQLIKSAFDRLNLSARAYHRILKVARTIADLEDSEDIMLPHIAEAIQYRSLDRKYW